MNNLRKLICGFLLLGLGTGLARATAEPLAEGAPFRVCALAGTEERPWVGIVWKDTEEAALLKIGDVFRGYKLKSVNMRDGVVVFESQDREWLLAVEADPVFAEKYQPAGTGAELDTYVTAEEFLNRYSVVVLADGTRLERPPGGWKSEPVTFEEFLAQHKSWEGAGLTAVDEELAARMAEAAAESQKAAQQLQSQEDIEKARYEALKRMAAELGVEPPKPDDLKPVTYEDFIRMHGEAATNAVLSSDKP